MNEHGERDVEGGVAGGNVLMELYQRTAQAKIDAIKSYVLKLLDTCSDTESKDPSYEVDDDDIESLLTFEVFKPNTNSKSTAVSPTKHNAKSSYVK